MDLRDYLRILRRGWPILLAFTVVGVGLATLLTITATKKYQSDVQIFVGLPNVGNATDLANGNTFTQARVQSYTSIATSPKVTDPVIRRLGLRNMTSRDLASKISADAPLNKVLINLHVQDTNPLRAQRIASAVAEQFTAVVEQTDIGADRQEIVTLTVVQPASYSGSPVYPRKVLNLAIGLLGGAIFGAAFLLIRDTLDNTVKGPHDFESLDTPVLGLIPLDKRTQTSPIAFRHDPHSVRSEAYRQLRTNLAFVNVDHAPKMIAITSAIPGEGKSTTAINLAAALAETGTRVCLVEADLRRPTIAKVLGLVGEVGFTSVLINRSSLADALQTAGHNLSVLTCGPIPPNPSELLVSEHARTVLREVQSMFDVTIVDTAPLLPVADGAEIATIVDATLIVHKAGSTTREQVTRSVQALAKVGERPVGAVLNMVSRSSGKYDYGYTYYYSYRPDRSSRITS